MAMRLRICVMKLGRVLNESPVMRPVPPLPSAHQLIRDSPHPYHQRFTKVYTVSSGANLIWGKEIRAYSNMVSFYAFTIYELSKQFYNMIKSLYGAELHHVADIIGTHNSTIVLCLNYFLLSGHVLDTLVKKDISTAMAKLPDEMVQKMKFELHKLEASNVMVIAGLIANERHGDAEILELKLKILTKLLEKFKNYEEAEPDNEEVKLSLKFFSDEFEKVNKLKNAQFEKVNKLKNAEVEVDNCNTGEVRDLYVPVRMMKKDEDSGDGEKFDLVFSDVRFVKRE